MGWYFRKSKSVGPFRVNFSKSGLSFSTGVKGARMSFGPRGTYVNIGRNGLYYRKKLGSAQDKRSVETQANSKYLLNQADSATFQTVDAVKVQECSDELSVTNQAIVKDIKCARIVSWIWAIISAILIVSVGWWTGLIMLAIRCLLKQFFRAEVNYEMDSDATLEWEKFAEVFSTLSACKKLWIIETEQNVINTKTNAGAHRNLTRSALKFSRIKANKHNGLGVSSNAQSIKLKGKQCAILFLPGDVIIKKGSQFIAVSYKDLNLYTGTTSFIETDPVPKDATVIRYTWQYVNKNGSPDKRYSNNRQLPVCQYGQIKLLAGNQLSIEIHVSNSVATANVGSAFRCYANYLRELPQRELVLASPSTASEAKGNAVAPIKPRVVEVTDNYADVLGEPEMPIESQDLVDEMLMFLKEE